MYRQPSTGQDERVRMAQVRCAELNRLRAMRAGLAADLKQAEEDVAARSKAVVREEADVARYEDGVWAFVYELFADGEARLTKEQREAAEAMARYQEAIALHARLRQGLDDIDRKLAAFGGAEAELAQAQAARLDELLAGGGPAAEELLALDEEAAAVRARLAHVDEALAAGGNAMVTLDRVAKRLEEAADWSATDLVLGAREARHARRDRYDRARGLAGVAQAELTMFERELADVELRLDARLAPEGGLPAFVGYRPGFLETWVSHLLAPSSVNANIGHAQATTRAVAAAVEQSLAALRQQRAALEARAAHVDARLAALTAPS